MRGCRLRFTPPIESFSLCHYAANYIQEPPIQGFYQMKVLISFLRYSNLLSMQIH